MGRTRWFLIEVKADSPIEDRLQVVLSISRWQNSQGKPDGLISCDTCTAQSAISALARFSLPKDLRETL